ncbi:hypothetical protein N656DRAFT_353729 [Canariomyces notabilis]|uniref:Endonuclease/exonuclease/phosphatase domain-containing protein n=1 Tax=Canariomyces notabilis TaxID=2074819 RepID=A0AAN6T9I6_9PEZI|nr:hypothetical protein N656DRAFT_353729 [Canariomyces arenarius]
MGISILQWNTQGIKENLEVLLEEANRYHLVHRPGSRAAIFVGKRFDLSQWDYEVAEDWCRVWFLGQEGPGLEIWSIYNPPTDKTLLSTLLQQIPRPTNQVILMEDFNLQHPL